MKLSIRIVALSGIVVFAGHSAAGWAQGPCAALTGAARGECMHEEARARSAYNRQLKESRAPELNARFQANRDAAAAQREQMRLEAANRASRGYDRPLPNDYAAPSQNARAQAAAERQREAEAARAARHEALLNAPKAGPALTKTLDALVRQDAKGWMVNVYDAGSMTNVRIIDGSVSSGHYVLHGDYTYNGGEQGWVEAKMSGAQLDCIQFHDAMIGCRSLRTPEQGQFMRDIASNALQSGVSGGNGGAGSGGNSPDDNGLQQQVQQQQAEEANARAQAERDANAAAANAQWQSLQQPNSLGW